jgi:hypothetical protein
MQNSSSVLLEFEQNKINKNYMDARGDLVWVREVGGTPQLQWTHTWWPLVSRKEMSQFI